MVLEPKKLFLGPEVSKVPILEATLESSLQYCVHQPYIGRNMLFYGCCGKPHCIGSSKK
jgi:hypothetical protein